MFKAIASGELLIDFNTVATDEMGYPTLEGHPGGATINCLATLRKFGAEAAFIGKAGNDAFGKMLQHTISHFGIDTVNVLLSDEAFTTLAFVTLDETGDREFSFARKPGADLLLRFDEVDLSVFEGADVFHFGTVSMTEEPSRSTTKQLVEYARSKGILIGYDPNLRRNLWANLDDAREQMLWGLSKADIVKISDEETALLTGAQDPKEAARILCEGGAKLVLVTLGAKGALWRCGGESGVVPGCPVKVADTNGAGDTFFGALLSRIALRGGLGNLNAQEITGIVAYANRAAALTTSRPGAIPAMPTRSELEG